LDALMNQQLPTSSIAGTIRGIHQQIIEAKSKQSSELTAKELDRIALKVCAECGIKDTGIPSVEVIDLCLKSWEEKFKARMNKHELNLAFELNVNGDLEEKVHHYQCFSREYFCDVLNLYLKKKAEAVMKQVEGISNESLPPVDISKSLMEDLISDRETVAKGEITNRSPLMSRFELLNELFDFPITEEQISKYRKVAVTEILARVSKDKHEARVNNKFGKEIELANQLERLKSQKLLTEKDEATIQFEVNRLLYCNTLMMWSESEFVAHVQMNMEEISK
jgi:hypothetical protein